MEPKSNHMLNAIASFSLGWYDLLEKISGVHKSQKNACRALHRLVEEAGVSLPLHLDAVLITIKRRRPLGEFQAWWPFFSMKTWAACILKDYPKMLLAGFRLEEASSWQNVFKDFWENYQHINPDHPIYSSTAAWELTIPYCFHGDEGRGLAKDPFLVLSFQPIISYLGMDVCNDSSPLENCWHICGSYLPFKCLDVQDILFQVWDHPWSKAFVHY